MEYLLTTQKLCCLTNGRSKGSSIINTVCNCGRKLCDECVLDIFRDKKKMERISKLWPQSSLNIMADHHYFYNKDCAVVQKYIERYGPPTLSRCIPTVKSSYVATAI
jgi:hypothetical protein